MQSREIEEKTFDERSLVGAAILAAINAHGGQEDRDGIPYFHHLLRVGVAMSPDPEAMIVGFLHDLLEDTDITKKDVERVFGFSIAEQVYILTRNEDESYWDYIDQLIEESLYYPKALMVKHADLLDNLAPWRQDFSGAEGLGACHRVALRLVENALIDRGFLNESQKYIRPDAGGTRWNTKAVNESGRVTGMGCDEATEPTEVSSGAYPESLEPALGSLLAALQAQQLYNDTEPPASPAAALKPDLCNPDNDTIQGQAE